MPGIPAPETAATALVTGASSGIGREIARELAALGHGVALVARRESELRHLADELAGKHGVRAEVIPCDLLDASARDGLASRIDELGLRVDVLVHAAGFDQPGEFTTTDADRQVQMTRIFCEVTIALCHTFGVPMRERGAGAILIVSSSSGFQPLPYDAVYGASKAFQNAFADALHAELRPHGISVTALCPGPVETEFFEVSGPHPVAKAVPSFMRREADVVARAGVAGLAAGKRVVVPGPIKMMVAPGKLTPRGLQLRVLRRLYSQR